MKDYRAVFWFRSEKEPELKASFVAVAKILHLPQAAAPDPKFAVEAVRIGSKATMAGCSSSTTPTTLRHDQPFLARARCAHAFC